MKKVSIFSLIMLLMSASTVYAVKPTRPLATDQRIKVVGFQEDNVVPVEATTFTTTQIAFGKDEMIQNIQNGDQDAWTVSVQKGLDNMMFLKPTIADSDTNMTVVTNKHTYYFHLRSQSDHQVGQRQATYAIHFKYPDEERAKMLANVEYNKQQHKALLNAKYSPQDYNWDYSFNGNRSITPLHIFDDGKFTYMQLQKGQPIPAVFAIDNKSGKESVVNYRLEGDYLVVQQVAPQFTLRDGKYHIASVFNNSLIQKIKSQGMA